MSANSISGEVSPEVAEALFRQHLDETHRQTNHFFEKVMLLQWLACIVLALMMSVQTWVGDSRHENFAMWAALLLGGAITVVPVWMIRVRPGATATRFVVATAQMLMSGLLIGLTAGRTETHFHIFGSLVLLSFYRDWRVLIPATIVVALDHFVRGAFWPATIFGSSNPGIWHSFEHVGWVIFENIFLAIGCLRSVEEMRSIANRTAALKASEQASRLIFEQAPIGMAVVGLDDRFLKVNTVLTDMVGYSAAELEARTPFDVTYKEDVDLSRVSARTMLGGASRSVIEKRYVRKNGEVVWTSRTACAIRDGAGQPHHFLLMVEDISDRKKSEEALRESKLHLESALRTNQLIMDNSQDVICAIDGGGRFATVNPASMTLWGYPPEEVVGRPWTDFVHPEDRLTSARAGAEAVAKKGAVDFVNRNVRSDGTIVHVLWSVSWSDAEKTMFCVAHDVTERTRIEHELRAAKDDADRANHAKSEFLSRMSHELRTPLNAILGFGQLLERQDPTSSQRTRIRYIVSAGRHLLNLINEVLDISRIEAGNLPLSLEPVCASEVLEETLDLMRPLAADRTIEVSIQTSIDNSCFVLADRQRLKQIMLNLFTNAVKYTPIGGKVTVSDIFYGTDVLRLIVNDNGPGIPVDKLSRLFTPFDRLGAEQSGVEGCGLGLALCQRLVHAMGGSLGATSTAGCGSTFWVELPLTQSPLARLAEKIHLPFQLGAGDGSERRKILYIEDNLSNLTLVEQLLADQPGVELITAIQGRIGLELAQQHRPDLILLDLHLPDIPGWEVLAHLQKDAETRAIPVVVISADATSRQVERLMKAGATAYLTKPIDMSEFYRVVSETKSEQLGAVESFAA